MPRMMDEEYTPEDDPGSLLGPGWEEEALGAEAFQEPPESPTNRAVDNRYRVPLIPQEQAYANHGSQENQVTTAAGGPSSATSLPPGGSRWGQQERSREPDPTPRRTEQGPPGGRPSAGEVLKSLPSAEDPWSPRAPLASPFPALCHPGCRLKGG